MKNIGAHASTPLPPMAVTDLATRLCVPSDDFSARTVHLTQFGMMREGPEKSWMRFSATETVDVMNTCFDWRARTGPMFCLTVVDRLSPADARSELRLLGILSLSEGAVDAAALQKGQVMRYLAEIPWSPDAILRNKMLEWTSMPNGLRVSHSSDFGRFSVDIQFDAEGRIGQVSAPDRPRLKGGRFLDSVWQGHFADYRLHCGRWIPFRGEVGWVIDGVLRIVWRAKLTGWRISSTQRSPLPSE